MIPPRRYRTAATNFWRLLKKLPKLRRPFSVLTKKHLYVYYVRLYILPQVIVQETDKAILLLLNLTCVTPTGEMPYITSTVPLQQKEQCSFHENQFYIHVYIMNFKHNYNDHSTFILKNETNICTNGFPNPPHSNVHRQWPMPVQYVDQVSNSCPG
jgi:hypothetical protein